jgi:hypothetical protein
MRSRASEASGELMRLVVVVGLKTSVITSTSNWPTKISSATRSLHIKKSASDSEYAVHMH